MVASPTVVSESILERTVEKVQSDGERLIGGERNRIVGGSVGALGFSAGLQFSDQMQKDKSFGYKMLSLAERINEHGHGLLILIDELQANSADLRQLLISYTEMVGEGRDVAIVLAGLPAAVSSVLNDRALMFLNRANKTTLGPLAEGDVDAFYAHALREAGLAITPELRRKASQAAQGSPYLLQLIGYNLVQYAKPTGVVTDEVLEDALISSQASFEEDVCQTTLAALSDKDIEFLDAMSLDRGPSRVSDVAARMGVTDDYMQKYRKRLISAGIISPARRGYVEFTAPFLASYLSNLRAEDAFA